MSAISQSDIGFLYHDLFYLFYICILYLFYRNNDYSIISKSLHYLFLFVLSSDFEGFDNHVITVTVRERVL